MSDKLRSVNTKFWNDPFVEELNPSEKLLFLYLLTNPLCNLLGIYEITIKRISYDTGMNSETIRKGFERFGNGKKAFFINNFIILPNFLKNQNLNSNMKIAVRRQFNELPDWLKINILRNDSEGFSNDSEGFRTIMECLGKYEIEIESEIEGEDEEEKEEKISYAENVKLLKSEYNKLISEHGEKNTLIFINVLNNYKGSTGKKYKSDYMTILNWVVDKVKKENKYISKPKLSA